MKLDPTNKRVFPIAVGSKFSYSWYPADAINEYPLAIGEELVLVAGLQARNNARIVIAGSYAMFSDKFQANNAAQADFVKSVLLWATKNAGVLRHANMKHFRVGEWVPFDQSDVQVDYHRLDPFVRRTLNNEKGL